MNPRCTLFLALLATCALAPAAPAAVLASQDFEGNTTTNGLDGTGDAAADAAANASLGTTAPGTVWDSGTGLPWTLALFDPGADGGPLETTDSGDVIGVVDGSYTFAPNGNGTNQLAGATDAAGNWMHVDDGDEGIVLAFDPVDASGYADLELGFIWAANNTTYEAGDFLDVSVNGVSVFNVAGNNDVGVPSALEDPDHLNRFSPELVDLSAYDGQTVNLVVTLATSSAAEDLGFDSLVLTGTAIPEPAALGLLGLAGMLSAAFSRRR